MGSYLTTVYSLPTIDDIFLTAAIINFLSITFGSISFYME